MTGPAAFRVPASTANLGAGFDALSLALDRHLRIEIEAADSLKIEARGTDRERIPLNATNLIYRVAAAVAEKRGRILPPFHLRIDNEIPLARGLGSSAAAIIAGVTCYELLMNDPLSAQDLLGYALEFEPHPDNLAAALHGGLISAAVSDEGVALVSSLAVKDGIQCVVVAPSFELSTETARGALPQSYSRQDAVYNIQRAAMTVAALVSGDWRLLRESMRDRIHQPYRAKLVPGLEEVLALACPGLVGIALSGAGPTIFALSEPAHAEAVGSAIAEIFVKHGVSAIPHLVNIDTTGRFVESS